MFKIFTFIVLINLISLASALKTLECNQLTPFVWSKFPLSIDLAKLNLFPDRDVLFSHNGFRDSIFNLTCKQDNKFELKNLILENEKIVYYLPDYMTVRNYSHEDPYFHNLISHRTYESDEESYKKNMMDYLHVNNLNAEEIELLRELGYNTTDIDRLFIGAFKLSHNYMRIRKERLANIRIPIESRLNITAGIIDLNDSQMPLTNAFQNEIRNLPLNYEDSIAKYDSLISTFGTHYFQYFTVGGLAKASFKLLDEAPVQLDQLSEDEFKNDQPFKFDLTGVEFNVDENFGSNERYFLSDGKIHKRTINFYGGSIETRNHTLKKWKPSALLDPWLIGGGLAPLSRLIKDKKQKRNFLRAMMAYLDKAEILNLKETCNQLEEVSEGDKWFVNYKQKVDDLNERKFINHTQLVSLSTQFNDDINIEIRKRKMFSSPVGGNMFISNLDKVDKENADKIHDISAANSHLISFWLIVITSVLHLHLRFN